MVVVVGVGAGAAAVGSPTIASPVTWQDDTASVQMPAWKELSTSPLARSNLKISPLTLSATHTEVWSGSSATAQGKKQGCMPSGPHWAPYASVAM